MKQRLLKGTVLLFGAAMALYSCRDGMKGSAFISFRLSSDYSDFYTGRISAGTLSKAEGITLPDTGSFILSVTDSDGEPVYNGPYGGRPEPMQVSSGAYDLSLRSEVFDTPAFSKPLFGDDRTVVLEDGQTLSVAFGCRQINCGIRLLFSDSFRSRFEGAGITISSDGHSLPYPLEETRTAYFMPGILRVTAEQNGEETPLLSRQLEAADMMTVRLSVADSYGENTFSVEVDTSRNWIYEDFVLGSGNNGSSADKAMTVADLILNMGVEDVWVAGYIVGGDMTTANVKFEGPFSKTTHLAIASSTEASSREECAAVELPSQKLRDALNLVDNPGLIGKKLYVCGDIENYFGYPGVKNAKEFVLE